MAKNSESKIFAFLGVFLTIIGFIIVMLVRRNDKYAMYYAKQGLALFITGIIVWVVSVLLAFLLIGFFVGPILNIILLILWIIGIVYSLSGEMKPIPIIGKFGEKFKF
jgi:uncharacterized membrane protein